jgi:hypothetical protein
MPLPVSLEEVVGEMEMAHQGYRAFLNRQTGEVYGTTDTILDDVDQEVEALPDWEQEMVAKVREILDSEEWIEIPNRESHEDYRLMERYCRDCSEGRLQEELLVALQGRGAFGRFKDVLHRRGLLEGWYRYRREELTAEVMAWLEAEGIPYRPTAAQGESG